MSIAVTPVHELENALPDWSDDLRELATTIRDWMHTHIANTHPHLGRPGDVCPYVKGALHRHQSLYYAPYHDRDYSLDKVAAFMKKASHLFDELPPGESGPQDFKALIALFPGLDADIAPSLIDAVHIFLKRDIIASGKMIGQFYPSNTELGLHNPAFRPFQSPAPLLVIRRMQLTDLHFLNAVPEFVQAYCDHFGIRTKEELGQRLEKAGIEKLPDQWEADLVRAFGI